MDVNDNHQVYSEEVQEILGYIPNWIIRIGISIIAFAVLTLLIITWFLKYPVIISGSIMITSESPPVDIVAQATGRLHLLVENGIVAEENNVLGYISSSSDFTDIMIMGEVINEISFNDNKDKVIDQLSKVIQLRDFSLGEIQPSFENLISQINSLVLFYELDFYQKQINQLHEKIFMYQELNGKLNDQQDLLQEEFIYTKNIFLSDSSLRTQDFISERDLNNSRLNLLQRKRSVEDAKMAILNNTALIKDYEGSIQELAMEQHRQETQLILGIEESLKVLKSHFSSYKQTYLLQSPIRGSIVFFDYLVDNRFVQPGQVIMTVIPDKPEVFGIVKVPITGAGRINTNQRINISLENYPSEEYGKVLGVVDQITPIPRENTYSIRVRLPKGLETTYGQTLDFKQQMQGTADIITEDLRLLERIFYQFRRLIDQIE